MTTSTSEVKKLICSFDGLILEKLGFENITPRGIQQSCPIHQGDNPAAFSYDRSKCCWSCFTHGCHNKFGNDIIGLVRAIRKYNFNEAMDWINLVINDPELTAGYIPNTSQISQIIENPTIDQSSIERLTKNYSSIEDRQFKESTLIHFQCGVSSLKSKIQHHRLMIPIRNDLGQLIGFTGRSIYKKCERTNAYHPDWVNLDGKYSAIFSKWRHYPKGLNKGIELYNFHEAIDYIRKVGFAVVVEGPFDLWRFWELGVKNCVASYGCSISNQQIKKLAAQCECIAICFDDDEAGANGYKKSKVLYGDKIKVEKIALPSGKDPGSLTPNDYNSIIKPQLSVLRKRYANENNNNYW